MNRMIMDKVRCPQASANLSETYWKEALMIAAYLTKFYPTSALRLTTPFEAWHGEKPDISHLRIFGCMCYMKVDDGKKYPSRATAGLFMGYPDKSKGYRVLWLDTMTIDESRNVVFDETKLGPKDRNLMKQSLLC